MSRLRYWNPEIDADEELWTCPFCGAELHCDCVGDECPSCAEPIDDEEEPK